MHIYIMVSMLYAKSERLAFSPVGGVVLTTLPDRHKDRRTYRQTNKLIPVYLGYPPTQLSFVEV